MARLKPGHAPARFRCDDVVLNGHLALPANPMGVVIVAGAPAAEPRPGASRLLLESLQRTSLGTFTLNLQTTAGHDAPDPQMHLAALSARLRAAVRWLRDFVGGAPLPLGCFVAGAAAPAALLAAAEQPAEISALVVQGGRPDLTGPALRFVVAPTLFIVGSDDEAGLAAAQLAFDQVGGAKSLEIVLGAGADLGARATSGLVVTNAAGWFAEYFSPATVR